MRASDSPNPIPSPSLLAPVAAALTLATVLVYAEAHNRPTYVAPANVADTAFSASRALATLAAITHDQPRPTGSHALDEARDRAADALRALGLQPTVSESFVCGRRGACARVHHLVARFEGARREAVLVLAHLDSVPAGPGAADDGQGVAIVIELARALRQAPHTGRSFIFLIDEGEEAGLLGIQGFLRDHPWAADVRAAVNLEARGTEGLPVLFEVGGDGSVIRAMAPTLPTVWSSSFASMVYALMPNDTDFSLLRARGVVGANFAFVDGVGRYHTARDDAAYLSPATVQAQGDAALAAARALAVGDLGPRRPTAWVDLGPLGVLPYGRSTAVLAATLALAGVIIALARERRSRGLSWSPVYWGAGATLLLPLSTAMLAEGGRRVVALSGALPVPFIAAPGALWVCAMATACGVMAVAMALARGRLDAFGFSAGLALGTGIAALVVAMVALPATPIVLTGAVTGSLAMLFRSARLSPRLEPLWASLFALGPALSMAMGWAVGRVIAGQLGLAAIAAGLSLGASGLIATFVPLVLPARARWWPAAGCAVVWLVAAGVAATREPFDEGSPQRVNVPVVQIEGSTARAWVSAEWGRPWGDPPRAMVAALPGRATTNGLAVPWLRSPMPFVDVPGVALVAPVVEIERHGGRVRMHATSRRGATTFVVYARGVGFQGWSVDGRSASPRRVSAEWWSVWVYGVGSEGVVVELPDRADAIALDVDWSHPVDLARARAARPSSAAPSQEGDVVMAGVRVAPAGTVAGAVQR